MQSKSRNTRGVKEGERRKQEGGREERDARILLELQVTPHLASVT